MGSSTGAWSCRGRLFTDLHAWERMDGLVVWFQGSTPFVGYLGNGGWEHQVEVERRLGVGYRAVRLGLPSLIL